MLVTLSYPPIILAEQFLYVKGRERIIIIDIKINFMNANKILYEHLQ